MNRQKLEAAAQNGIISPEQVEKLAKFWDSDAPESSSEEPLRFIRSFGDVFITIGIVLVSSAISLMGVAGSANLVPFVILLGLTEWLVGMRRLALPGIALLGGLLYFAHKLFLDLPLDTGNAEMLAAIVMIILSGLFYLRYKMPFAFLAMAASLLLFVQRLFGLDTVSYPIIYAGYGLAVFLVAMWFDAQDIERKNHKSDTGFWLHMLAAPLIARGIIFAIIQARFDGPMNEILVIAFFIAFFLIALFVDRRALMASSLIFAFIAIISLLRNSLQSVDMMIWIIFAVLGLVMIVVGVKWYAIRTFIFAPIGKGRLASLVPAFGGNVSS